MASACDQFSASRYSLSAPPRPNSAAGTTAAAIMARNASTGSGSCEAEEIAGDAGGDAPEQRVGDDADGGDDQRLCERGAVAANQLHRQHADGDQDRRVEGR